MTPAFPLSLFICFLQVSIFEILIKFCQARLPFIGRIRLSHFVERLGINTLVGFGPLKVPRPMPSNVHVSFGNANSGMQVGINPGTIRNQFRWDHQAGRFEIHRLR